MRQSWHQFAIVNLPRNMYQRALFLTLCLVLIHAKPVKRKLNFNMYVLKPSGNDYEPAPLKVLFSTNGVSRFGPMLEYLVQRVQGLFSVKVNPEENYVNEQENLVEDEAAGVKMKGVILRPSREKPGIFQVEIPVTVDDGQPNSIKQRSL